MQERGFYILPSQLFGNVRRQAAADPNLNETLSNIFHAIENSAKGAASEEDMKGPVRRHRREQQQTRSDGAEAQRDVGEDSR